MATVEYLNKSDAPTAPKPMTKQAKESLGLLQGLDKGKVARLTPEKDQTIRSWRSSLSRVAKNQGMKIEQWEVDGILYVQKV